MHYLRRKQKFLLWIEVKVCAARNVTQQKVPTCKRFSAVEFSCVLLVLFISCWDRVWREILYLRIQLVAFICLTAWFWREAS